MTARLIDDHILVLTGRELIQAALAVEQYISEQQRRNGAPPTIGWASLARRGANVTKRFVPDETKTRTLEVVEAGSAPEVDRSQEMTAVEAAEFLGVTQQYVRRIRGKIGTLPGRQIKFSREAVIAWKMHCDERKAQHGRPG